MKRNLIVALLMTGLLAAALAGCSSTASSGSASASASADASASASSDQSAQDNPAVGFWAIDDNAQVGFNAALNLSDDNFAELEIADSYLSGTWAADGQNVTITFDDPYGTEENGKTASVQVNGDNLILGQADGSKLVFAKADMEQYYSTHGMSAAGDIEEGDIVLDENGEVIDEADMVESKIEDIEPVSLADDETISMKVTGKGNDEYGDYGYRVSITNKTDKSIFVLSSEEPFKLDGEDIEAGFGETVDAGDTVETFMFFVSDKVVSADDLKNVTGTIDVLDADTDKTIESIDFKIA